MTRLQKLMYYVLGLDKSQESSWAKAVQEVGIDSEQIGAYLAAAWRRGYVEGLEEGRSCKYQTHAAMVLRHLLDSNEGKPLGQWTVPGDLSLKILSLKKEGML